MTLIDHDTVLWLLGLVDAAADEAEYFAEVESGLLLLALVDAEA